MSERERTCRRRARAWSLYGLASSGFAAAILVAVLPACVRQDAGSALSSPGLLAACWSSGLGLAILLGAVAAPMLGTLSDLLRAKKLFLSLFAGLGVVSTGLLILVQSGDGLWSTLLVALNGLGFGGSLVFHDALLPHAARPADLDRVSARGCALGHLGGGSLLAAGLLLARLPGAWGPRMYLAGAALWWALFSIPLLALVPEPRTPAGRPERQLPLKAAFRRLGSTLRDLRGRPEPFKHLLACLAFLGGIGAIPFAALIHGMQLGLGRLELILALLLVQMVAVPFSLLFGSLPRPEGEAPGSRRARLRPVFLVLVLLNLALLPALGTVGTRFLPRGWTGAAPPPYQGGAGYAGQGLLSADDPALVYMGSWRSEPVEAGALKARSARLYRTGERAGDRLELRFHGEELVLICAAGPGFGIWHVELDGLPLPGADGRPLILNCYQPAVHWDLTWRLRAPEPGLHTLALSNYGEKDTRSAGTLLALGAVRVLEPRRDSSLPLVLGLILALEAACAGLAFLLGPLASGLAARLTTKTGLLLAVAACALAALYGHLLLDSILHYWCLAWLAACLQGGCRALGRSLFAGLIPAARSGEFFGLFALVEKLAALLGPLLFAGAAALFEAGRPAALSLALLFLAGAGLLLRVRVEEGRAAARAESSRPTGN